jgi:ABC-type lipopolysaccharide export system ATPase subunit
VREALPMVDRAYVIESGRIIASGVPRDLVRDPRVRAAYLGDWFDGGSEPRARSETLAREAMEA